MRAGSKLTFTVDGTVDSDGSVQIGCKRFSEAEIREVAKNLTVTEPPRPPQRKTGDVLRASDGTVFIVAEEYDGGKPKLWNMSTDTYCDEDYWTKRGHVDIERVGRFDGSRYEVVYP